MADDVRQQLYDRIRASSKDEVILEEMVRLGFWSDDQPSQPALDLKREVELQRLVRSLTSETSRLHNVEALKKEARRRRMAEARARREETKRKREEARKAKARAWAERKARQIDYLGEGVSTELGQTEAGALREGLPLLHTAAELAAAMGIEVGALRRLVFHRRVSKTTHYVRFQIPKKTGGLRQISAPMPRLKAAQRWVATEILDKVPLHDAAHGFVAGRSILTNAAPHVGQPVVINLDLKDFFPTLTWVRVRGLFRSLGYSPEAATILALLCTEPDVAEVELDGQRWYVHQGERVLPQGSPASPALTNVVAYKLDVRLQGLADKLGYRYTRYADDLTFSGPPDHVGGLLKAVATIVADEGFVLHPDKTRVMRRGSRQEVTGLTVNDGLGVPRPLRRRFRSALHQLKRQGPDAVTWGHGPDLFASLYGFASFVAMVQPAHGQPLREEVRALAEQHGWTPPKRKVYEKRSAPPVAEAAAPPPPAHRASAVQPEPVPEAAATEASSEDEGSKPKAKWYEFWRWFES